MADTHDSSLDQAIPVWQGVINITHKLSSEQKAEDHGEAAHEAPQHAFEMPFEQLGALVMGHVVAGDRAKEKADQHYMAAGLYLIAAKERVQKTKGLTWSRFLFQHCKISRRRADEIIMIADGRTTIEKVREVKAESVRKARDKAKNSALRSAQSSEIHQQNQQRPTSVTAPAPESFPREAPWKATEDAVEEARSTSANAGDERSAILSRLVARLNRASLPELRTVQKSINIIIGE